ncbi:ubiquinol-cytochrome c reductase iron-sulfur subunit [Arcobacter sp. 31_11_sub10_T18]|nr:ubiquinol-cytochrome c reductase iron-sulfur subunit [Arcobacter sp. 31_11_sub10_T18]
MSNNTNRRSFIGFSFAAVAAAGAVPMLIGMKKAWDPLPSVLAGGFTEVDLTTLKPGNPATVEWRGKPVFVLKKTAEMESSDRDLIVGEDRFTVAIGLCTHLGCIPAWKKTAWKCACHGGQFDASGKQTFGPPPRPLDLPEFGLKGNILVLGETGPEYKKLMTAKV